MILRRDVPTIRPWLITCGSRDFRHPSTKHTPAYVLDVYNTWARLFQSTGNQPFPVECVVVVAGIVTFMQDETAGRSTFEGVHIRGISLFNQVTTNKALRNFSTHLLWAVGQEVLEFYDDSGISSVRLNKGVPIDAQA